MHAHITGRYGPCNIVTIKIVIRNVVKAVQSYVDIDVMHQRMLNTEYADYQLEVLI